MRTKRLTRSEILRKIRSIALPHRKRNAVIEPDVGPGSLGYMRERDDIGTVDAHETVGGQLFNEVFKTVKHDDGGIRVCQMNLDILAPTFYIMCFNIGLIG